MAWDGQAHLKNALMAENLRSKMAKAHEALCAGLDVPSHGRELGAEVLTELRKHVPSYEQEQLLRTCVLAKVPTPVLVTLEDLAASYREHLSVPPSDFADAYHRFVESVIAKTALHKSSEPFPVAKVPSVFLDTWEEESVLWRNEFFAIRLLVHEDGDEWLLEGVVEGKASERAIAALREDVVPIVRLLMRLGEPQIGPPYPIISKGIPSLCEGVAVPYGVLPMVRASLRHYFLSPAKQLKKDSLVRRIRNALLLLREADRQPNDALAAVLCSCAMEALLCRDISNITGQLARRGAALLEPDGTQRYGAERYIRRMYGQRCKLLHGEEVEGQGPRRDESYVLVSSVLAGALEWAPLDPPDAKHSDFCTELDRASAAGTPFHDAPESAASLLGLWREADGMSEQDFQDYIC